MKSIILLNLKINFTLYTIFYLISTFVKWEIYNPFWWVLKIPTANSEDRFLGLFCFLMWEGMLLFLISGYKSEGKISSGGRY